MKHLNINVIGGGCVTVASNCVDGEWHCTALQFDIVGTGPTREAAFEQMKELMGNYINHVARQKGNVALFNPSDRAEWEIADKKDFLMVVATRPST